MKSKRAFGFALVANVAPISLCFLYQKGALLLFSLFPLVHILLFLLNHSAAKTMFQTVLLGLLHIAVTLCTHQLFGWLYLQYVFYDVEGNRHDGDIGWCNLDDDSACGFGDSLLPKAAQHQCVQRRTEELILQGIAGVQPHPKNKIHFPAYKNRPPNQTVCFCLYMYACASQPSAVAALIRLMPSLAYLDSGPPTV